jgi:hypothetical protein
MLMSNTVDDITTDWHCQACPFGINASIRSCINGAAARLNIILNLQKVSFSDSECNKSIWHCWRCVFDINNNFLTTSIHDVSAVHLVNTDAKHTIGNVQYHKTSESLYLATILWTYSC